MTASSTGRNRIAFWPGGEINTSMRSPFIRRPAIDRINGLHEGNAGRSVRMVHTRWGGAAISISVIISRTVVAFHSLFELAGFETREDPITFLSKHYQAGQPKALNSDGLWGRISLPQEFLGAPPKAPKAYGRDGSQVSPGRPWRARFFSARRCKGGPSQNRPRVSWRETGRGRRPTSDGAGRCWLAELLAPWRQ